MAVLKSWCSSYHSLSKEQRALRIFSLHGGAPIRVEIMIVVCILTRPVQLIFGRSVRYRLCYEYKFAFWTLLIESAVFTMRNCLLSIKENMTPPRCQSFGK